MLWTRRWFLKRLGLGALAGSGYMLGAGVQAQEVCRRVNGSGSYSLGPFEALEASRESVFLITDLGFDETMMFCKVSTNDEPFRFPTASMGVVEFGAHEFFMDMASMEINSLDIVEGNDGPEVAITGLLRSETRLFSGDKRQTFIEEQIPFDLRAKPHVYGMAGEHSNTNFSLTAHFDAGKEHAAIFGEASTFAGHLSQGSIIIIA